MFFLKNLLIFFCLGILAAGFFSRAYALKKDFAFLGLKLGMSESDVTNVLYRGVPS